MNFLAVEGNDVLDPEGNPLPNPGGDRMLPDLRTCLVDFMPSWVLPLKPIPNVGAPRRDRDAMSDGELMPTGSKRPAVSLCEDAPVRGPFG